MPDIENLMQEWPPEFEELLNQVTIAFRSAMWHSFLSCTDGD